MIFRNDPRQSAPSAASAVYLCRCWKCCLALRRVDFSRREWQNQAMNREDEFYYGRRQIIRYDKTGQPSYTWLPLRPADFLDPQEGDEFAQGARHDDDVRRLRRIFRYLHRYNPATLVLSQVKLRWEDSDIPQPAPDLMVIPQASEPDRPRLVFDVAAEQARPHFVLEVTAPRLAKLDLVDKLAIYAAAGVGEYFIVDSAQVDELSPIRYRLFGYTLDQRRYSALTPDRQGRLYSTVNRVWLALDTDEKQILVIDERTGTPVTPDPTYDEPSVAAHVEAASRADSIAAQLDFLRPDS
jgi:colicin import membrane protein